MNRSSKPPFRRPQEDGPIEQVIERVLVGKYVLFKGVFIELNIFNIGQINRITVLNRTFPVE